MRKLFSTLGVALTSAYLTVNEAFAELGTIDWEKPDKSLFDSDLRGVTHKDGLSSQESATTFLEQVGNVINFFLSFIGFIAVVYIIFQGFRYIVGDADDAKQKIINALIGLVIIMVAYTLVNFVTGGTSFLFSDEATIGTADNATVNNS